MIVIGSEVKNENVETVKVIGRISKMGKEYYQTAIKEEGKEESTFIPVYVKKGIEKFGFLTKETKLDKRKVAYTLYGLNPKNVWFPENEDGTIDHAVITK